MKEIKVLYREPIEAEYKNIKVYDDLDEYLKDYNGGKDFIRTGFEKWEKLNVNGKSYYCFNYDSYYSRIDYDELFLTEEVYKKILKYSIKSYELYERNLFRTQKNSNTRFTGTLSSEQEVIDYLKDEKRSWLPKICKEIDEDIELCNKKIEELNKKIFDYENDKKKLYDEDYLKSKIVCEYKFDSLYYKSMKDQAGLVKKVEE